MFETVSGFTTTGSSILTDVEALARCSLFWRSFTHWVGGMGVFVFVLAVMPLVGGQNIHLMRAESPGPSVGKLVPKIRKTSMILYKIYIFMTDVICVAIGFSFGSIVGVATIITAFCMGPLIEVFRVQCMEKLVIKYGN